MSRSVLIRFTAHAVVVLTGTLCGCRSTPKDPVAALLSDLEKAAEARDVTAIENRLAGGFVGSDGLPRPQVLDQARRYFALYEEVRLEIYGVEVQGRERVAFTIDFAGRAKAIGGLSSLLPPEAAYRFDCELVEEGGVLKLSKADWKVVPLPADEAGEAQVPAS